MLIRKYKAKNLKEALRQVKDDLGDDAIILSTRAVRSGLLRSELEVTAALPPLEQPGPSAQPATPAPPPPAPASLDVHQVARFLSPLRQELRALQAEVRGLSAPLRQSQQVEGALEELRELLRAVQESPDQPSAARADPEEPLRFELGRDVYERLLESGMRRSLAERIVLRVEARIPADPAEARISIDSIAASTMASDLRCTPAIETDGALDHGGHNGVGRTVALVGPAGVGKTTSLAKIAARAALMHRRAVAIVGCDADRMGAMRALGDTADLIGIPCVTAPDARGLREALARLAPRDLVLVDTSGHAPRDAAAISALGETLAEAGAEPLLVMSADMRVLEIDACVASYGALHPRALVLTKIDQAVALGALYDAAVSCALPVMYLSGGRRIPEDLEQATPQRIAALVLGFQFN